MSHVCLCTFVLCHEVGGVSTNDPPKSNAQPTFCWYLVHVLREYSYPSTTTHEYTHTHLFPAAVTTSSIVCAHRNPQLILPFHSMLYVRCVMQPLRGRYVAPMYGILYCFFVEASDTILSGLAVTNFSLLVDLPVFSGGLFSMARESPQIMPAVVIKPTSWPRHRRGGYECFGSMYYSVLHFR